MNEITVQLKEPITFGQREISQLIIQKPKVKHVKNLPINQSTWMVDHILTLISAIANEPPALIGELALSDLENIMEAISPFLSSSPKSGEPS